MASKGLVVLGLSLIAFVTSSSGTTHPTHFDVSSLNRDSFPSGFVFGVGSSAYQVDPHAKAFNIFFVLSYITYNLNFLLVFHGDDM